MRDALRLSVISRTATKSQTADSASLDRQQVVPTKCGSPVSPPSVSGATETLNEPGDDIPWNVSQAAKFLGVSPQTVYVWVGRKQIPHLRVMGRNIRFLRVDLERFRATFRREPEENQATSR